MRVRASSASALVVSLLANDVLAAVHGRHEHFHRKRTDMDVTVTDEVVEVMTEVVYVTVEWPSGETLGMEYPTDGPAPAASTTAPSVAAVPSYTASSAGSSVTDTFAPAATSVASSIATTVAPSVAPSVTPPAATSVAPSVDPPATTSVAPSVDPPAATSVALSVASIAPAAAQSSSFTPVDGGEFIQKPKSTPPVAVPTTMATVVRPASTPAAAPAPASTAASSSSSDSTKKRGLPYNDAGLTQYFTGATSKVSWAYNWDQTTSGLASGLEYVPCLWDTSASRTGSWAAHASSALTSGSTHLFSFNEPDLSSQANMDVQSAAQGFKTYMQPFAGQAKLGAPAVTNGGGQMGLTYLTNFISACSGCTIDFVNIHWYDSATNFAYFKSHVQDAYKAGGNRPVWITEFAASGSAAEQTAFLEVVIPWLDAQPYVERYAYFMAKDGVLLNGNSLSSIGSTFMSFVSSSISSLIANV